MDYWPRRRARCRRGARTTRRAATSRATRSGATTTRLLRGACSGSPTASRRAPARSAIACSSIPRRCSRRRSRAMPASAGSASTPTCSTRDAGSWFFLGELYTDLPLPVDDAGERALRHLHALHRHLPDARDRRAVPARCAALHLVPDDRAARPDPGGIAPADRQPHLRLRRLPAGLSVEQVRARDRASRTSGRATGSTRRAWSSCSHGRAAEFARAHRGSAIRRIGYERWLRNIAVALGNAPTSRGGRSPRSSRAPRRCLGARARARRRGRSRGTARPAAPGQSPRKAYAQVVDQTRAAPGAPRPGTTSSRLRLAPAAAALPASRTAK